MSQPKRQREARLFQNIAVIECADAATLTEVLAGVAGPYLVRRLSDTVVVVDHNQVEPILKGLRKAGYTPRLSGGAQ